MKEILLSLLVSSVTIVAGYIVLKESNVDLSKLWEKDKKQKEEHEEKIKPTVNNGKFKTFKKKQFKKKKLKFKKEFKKKNISENVQNNISKKIGKTPKKTPFVFQKRKPASTSKKTSVKKVKKNLKKSPEKVKTQVTPKNTIAYAPTKIEESGVEKGTKLKSTKKTLVNYEPELISVSLKEVTEVDLEDLIIDINDKNTKKDVDRNGDSISYTCSFKSENREEGMVTDGPCEDIGDVNFSFDKKTGILRWSFNEPGSTISGNYFFTVSGNDGLFSNLTQFQINVANINVSEPKNNTTSLNNLITTGDSVLNDPNIGDGK